MALIIRDMEARDFEGKARVHYLSWQETYAGLVDQCFLDEIFSYEKCLERARRSTQNHLVAELDGEIVGFAAFGPCANEDLPGCGEVYALYVLKAFHKRGIGYALMTACIDKLVEYPAVALWVLSNNQTGIRFYQRFGFAFDGKQQEITLGKPVMESRMIWRRSN